MKVLLLTLGSHGDVHPFVGLALEMRRRGHVPVIATNGHFEALVRGVGLEFLSIGSEEEYLRLTADKDLWSPSRAFKVVFQAVADTLKTSYEHVANFVQRHGDDAVVVHSSLGLAARVARDKLSFPLATVHLQPSVVFRVVRFSIVAATAFALIGFPTVAAAGGRWDGDRGQRYSDDNRKKSSRVDVRVDFEYSRNRIERHEDHVVHEDRVWVEPAYRTVHERVWVEPEYRIVCDRVWVEPIYEDRCERVWVPERFEIRETRYWDGYAWRIRAERVCVERGRWEDRPVRVCVREGYWQNVERRVVVCEGYWRTIERREQISAGYWTTSRVSGRFAAVDRGDRYRD